MPASMPSQLMLLLLQLGPVLTGSCDYVSTASGPCDDTANEGSCADYYQVFADLSYQYIQSPKYPGYYADNQVCRWVVSACHCYNPLRPEAKFRVEIEMLDYDMEDSPSCTFDYVEIKDGKRLWGRSFAQYCGNDCVVSNANNITHSSELHLLLTFQTDVYKPSKPQKFHGFLARYRCAEYETPVFDTLVLGPANYLLIVASCCLLVIFTSAAVTLSLREYRRKIQ